MRHRWIVTGVALSALPLLLPSFAAAQDRPDEDALFGAPASTPAPKEDEKRRDDAVFGAPTGQPSSAPAEAAPAPGATGNTDQAGDGPHNAAPSDPPVLDDGGFKRPDEGDVFGSDYQTRTSEEAAPEDPLRIGGQLYMRLLGSSYSDTDLSKAVLSMPTLADFYFDARPNDRVRGMVIGRLSYNPLASDLSAQLGGIAGGSSQSSGALGAGSGTDSASGDDPTDPDFILNQLWLRFDIRRTVFVTAGKQFVKWGVSRFWNPTDWLQPVRRNPLEPFDVRTGVPMVKLHAPWEAKGWNFYAIALLDNYQEPGTLYYNPASAPAYVSAALRAELVFGTVELGVDTLLQYQHPPKVGVDVSAGVGPLDVYGEVGIRSDVDGIFFRSEAIPFSDPVTGAPRNILYAQPYYTPGKVWASASGGLSWSTTVFDNATFSLGAEYFYNALGYDDPSIYPLLLLAGGYQPFYVGRHYGALFANLSGPGSWNNSAFTLSTLGNLTDRSFLSRLDYSVSLLTHLRLEAYAAVHYGNSRGEFRFGFETEEPVRYGTVTLPPFSIPAQAVDVGLSLRINI